MSVPATTSPARATSPSISDATPFASEPDVPPLENGDRLTRAEFERRYHAMPEVKKAELIEGSVYMPSPVRVKKHGVPHIHAATWAGVFHAATPGVIAADNSTARLDLDNEPQPDILLMIEPERGGQAKISEDDYVEGAPEFVCEVASSTVAIDLHAKLNVYRRNGVKEYVVVVVRDREVHWYVSAEGRYDRLPPDADGFFKSRVFPGLWLDPAALLAGDLARVLDVLRQGTSTPEHAAFVRTLNPANAPAATPDAGA